MTKNEQKQEVIDKLTPEQEAKLPEYRQKWIEIGLNTEPTNLEESIKYAKMAYKAIGEKNFPSDIRLCDSPFAAIELVHKEKGLAKSDIVNHFAYGNHDAGWLSFYDLLLNELGLECCRPLEGNIGLAKHCGWWLPYDEMIVFCHRPVEIHLDLDNNSRLHNPNGMAIRYRDNTGVWAIDGVLVDEQIVMRPETQTIEQLQKESNKEVQRLRIGRYGWEKYLEAINAEALDDRLNPIDNCHEYVFTGIDELNILLCVCCSTGKKFALEVPSSVKTCEEAQLEISGGLSAFTMDAS